MRRVLSGGIFLLLLAGATPSRADVASDQTAVMAADQAFFEASLQRKGAAWRDFAAADATLPAGTGKEAIGAAYAKVYAHPGFALTWHPTEAKVVGDVAITTGPYEEHSTDAAGRASVETGHYVTVWERQKDGSWRFAWDGGTADK